MPYKEFHYRWEWKLKSSPEALWPFASDTNTFNRDTGLPAIEQRAGKEAYMPNARRRLRLFRLGIAVEWEEEPFEWVRPTRFGVNRRYTRGPVAELRTLVDITPEADGGSRVVYQVWAAPKNLLGLVGIPIQIGLISARMFERAFRQYDRAASSATPTPLMLPAKVDFAPGGRARLKELRDALLERGAAPHLVKRLVETIEQADEMALARLRPYALADHWGAPRRAVLELCLLATRLGMLELHWELLCPLCRGVRYSTDTMDDIMPQIHCEVCNIDFEANFERSVELTFSPNPAIRRGVQGEFCVGGPQLTPHIMAQQLLPPGAGRELTLPLENGRYRVRALGIPGGQYLVAAEDGQREAAFRAAPEGWGADEPRVALLPHVRLENATADEQLLVLERMAWTDQAVTAAEVTAMQMFRDLFAREALRPGAHISVGSLTVLFTDLRGSTRLYREVGDAVAFGRVLDHFDVLREAIDFEQGALVKTIGDAVMAVFVHPVHAIRAMLKAQHELAHPPEGLPPLELKAGMHYGPCIAVTLNDRLDYFGSTVNIASRLEGLAANGGLVISESVWRDPEVVEYLAGAASMITVEPFEAMLRGFGEQRFELRRVMIIDS